MTTDQIKDMQSALHITPDGFWGPKSMAACQAWLRRLMPDPNPWPDQYESRLSAFYGQPGDESRLVELDVSGLDVRYEGAPVKIIRCHSKVAASLGRVLAAVSSTHPEVLRLYDGCYNFRPMRNGTYPSLHARGAAIDLWSSANDNTAHWPDVALMPLAVMEAFAREGWLSAAAFWGRDAMHFQATR